MKTIWVGKTTENNLKKSLRNFFHFLLIDAVPVFLLLVVMACGMALISSKLNEPRSVDIQIPIEKLH